MQTTEYRSSPDLASMSGRIDRLEEGVRLIADTIKRAYGGLEEALQVLRREVGDEAEARAHLTELVERFPLVLAAAVEQLTDELRATSFRTVESVGAVIRGREPMLRLEESSALV